MASEGSRLADLSDRDLVGAFQDGLSQAYDEIYRRYRPRVSSVCFRMLDSSDAEEAVQETFLKAYQALGRFNGRYQVGAWLSRIATNVCFDHLRARSRSARVVQLPPESEVVDLGTQPEEIVVGGSERLDEAIAEIQPVHAQALQLRAVYGMSHKEIADRLGMTAPQVKALLHRARTSLKRAWEQASGWAAAPLWWARTAVWRGRPRTETVPASESFSPLFAERVAASAVMIAVALSGAPSVMQSERSASVARDQARGHTEKKGMPRKAKSPRTSRSDMAAAPVAQSAGIDVASVTETIDTQIEPPAAQPPTTPGGPGVPIVNPSQARPIKQVVRKIVETVAEPK